MVAERPVGKVERLERSVAPRNPLRHRRQPLGIGAQVLSTNAFQFGHVCRFLKHQLPRLVWMEVNEPQQLRRLASQRQHSGVEAKLGQIEVPYVFVQRARIDAGGLDLFHHSGSGVPAIHPA